MTAPVNHNPTQSSSLAPNVIAWESTRACNFACVHCRAQAQKLPDPNQLTTQEALNLVDQIADLCKPVLIISGGDPLKRKDIFQIASYASSIGIRVVMSPSGSDITPHVIEKMKISGVKMISISLDGSTSEIHDNFRKVPGAFELALKNMSYARQGGLAFRVNTTVTQHNLDDLSNILKLVTQMGAKEWDVFMLVPTGRGKVNMEISPKQYEETLQFIYNVSQTSSIPVKMTCAPQFMRIIKQKEQKDSAKSTPIGRHANGRGCMAGNGFCFVSHSGEIFGCGFLPISAGNIRQQNFKQIYQQSPLFLELRNQGLLKGKCGKCRYKTICGGCRARALSVHKSHLEEEPYCIYKP
jgi:AdoMet-dependent heme synthase